MGALAFDASEPLDALGQWPSAPQLFYKFPDMVSNLYIIFSVTSPTITMKNDNKPMFVPFEKRR